MATASHLPTRTSRTLAWAGFLADRRVGALALVGFGGWHVIDGVFSHWVTGIHRVRMDSANPLFWDLLWFCIFGLVPLVLGWLAHRSGPGRGHGRGAAAALALAAIVAGPMAARPSAGSDQMMVMFRPGMQGAEAFNALASVDARVLWVDGSGGLWTVSMTDPTRADELYSRGAWLVSSSAVAVGCLSWVRVVA